MNEAVRTTQEKRSGGVARSGLDALRMTPRRPTPHRPPNRPNPRHRAPKPPPELPLFFMLSHLEEDGPVRLDGVKLGVCEVMGLELDEPKLGAFAGALNALRLPASSSSSASTRRTWAGCGPQLHRGAAWQPAPADEGRAESLRGLLTDLETRDGILDRRFYAVVRVRSFRRPAGPAGAGRALRPSPGRPAAADVSRVGRPRRHARGFRRGDAGGVEGQPARGARRETGWSAPSTWASGPARWPPASSRASWRRERPMDLSIHLGPIPAEQAARTLEWQKVRFESAQSLSLQAGQHDVAGGEIALEDVTRLRDEVQRGRERLFHASLSVTLHAKDEASLKEMTQRAKAHFAGDPGQAGQPGLPPARGHPVHAAPGAERRRRVAQPGHVQSWRGSSPSRRPDLDTRSGTLYGIDMRACSPVVYDPWDGTHLNANTAVLARSGSGKIVRNQAGSAQGSVTGASPPTSSTRRASTRTWPAPPEAGFSLPACEGQGMNPFVIDRGDDEELLQRIGSLRRLIEVMVGERLGAERRASLDHALAGYYAHSRERTGFRDFYAYLQEGEAH